MKSQLSQEYDVDNRYRGFEKDPDTGLALAADNEAGKRFLAQFIERDRLQEKNNIESERREDNRFTFAAQGGTIPISALPYAPQGNASIGNTDQRLGFLNLFRTTPS